MMANWIVSDELDARLRDRLGGADVSGYVEQLIADQLNCDDDPAYQAEVASQMDASEADIAAGRVTEAREAMRRIADDRGIKFSR